MFNKPLRRILKLCYIPKWRVSNGALCSGVVQELNVMKTCGGWKYISTSLHGGELWALLPTGVPQGKRTLGTHWTSDWAGSEADLDIVENKEISFPLPTIKPQFLCRPARSLYRLSERCFLLCKVLVLIFPSLISVAVTECHSDATEEVFFLVGWY